MTRLRLGIVGMSEGNGHPYSWSAIINGYDSAAMAECPFASIPAYLAERSFPQDQLAGAEVTHVWTQSPTLSAHIASAARIPHVVGELPHMVGEVDALLLARDDAEHHRTLSAPFLRAGLPVYLDKPAALSVRDLDELYALTPDPRQIFSCSALRFAEELRLSDAEAARLGALRRVVGVTPKSWERYAAHVIDPVISFVRPGAVANSDVRAEGGAVRLRVRWESGLIGEFEATGQEHGEIALTYVGERASVRKVFVDSFSAFRAALQLFLNDVRQNRSAIGYEHLRELVSLIELGREARTTASPVRKAPEPLRTSTKSGRGSTVMPTGPITTFARSLELNARLHAMIPGGCHTYSKGEDQFPSLGPRVIERASGAYCWDVDGNRYIDWAMGTRAIILGHANEAVNAAVLRHISAGCNFSRPGLIELETAQMLLELLPQFEMVKFGKNGSDVTTAAVRLARAATGRKYVAQCIDHPFFSTHDWFIGSTAMNAGVPEEVSRLTLGFHYNDLDSLKALNNRYPGQIAAAILEPVKNDEPRDGFLQRLREFATEQGIVLIFDEMISGLRFDLRGAHHRWGVYPDLALFGKSIANGFSFSLLAGRRELMELGGLHHDKRRVFLLSQTHSSETTGLAACQATLSEYQRLDTNAHIWKTGGQLVQGFRALAAAESVTDYVRMIGFDCNPQIVCTRADGQYWPELAAAFHQELISHGVLIPWISVTQSHGAAELDATFSACQHAMRTVRRALELEHINDAFVGEAPKPVFRTFNRCRQTRCGRLYPEAPQLPCCTAADGRDAK
jgi:glutamate-1-semialdehyde 2,1-aminomutase